MCPQACTRTALGQTGRVLLQEAQVVFHIPCVGAQLLPQLLHLLQKGFVEGLPVGPHVAAELLHLLVQVAAQLGQQFLQLLGIVPQLATHVLSHGPQPLPQLIRVGRDLGLQLLGILLHLEGQPLELVVELLLDFLRRCQGGLQVVHVLAQRGLHALRVGSQLVSQLLGVSVDLGAQLIRVWPKALLQLAHVVPDLLAHLVGVGQQPGPQVLQLLPNLLLQLLGVLAQAFVQLRGKGHQLLLQVIGVGVHLPNLVLEEGTAGEGHKGATVTLGITCPDLVSLYTPA
uniref:Uncharacterized protein n=1 Tax=Ursus americanus TaxID=9643 RepID=A0A452S0P5_URSAM